MSQPLSVWSSLRVIARSAALRSTVKAALFERLRSAGGGALYILAIFAGAVAGLGLAIALFAGLFFCLDKIGRQAELWLWPQSAQPVFHTLPASAKAESEWRWALQSAPSPNPKEARFAEEVLSAFTQARTDHSPVMGMTPETRRRLLALLLDRKNAALAARAQSDKESLLGDALLLARLLKEGQTIEQAAAALRARASATPAASPAELRFNALERELSGAKPQSALTISSAERFSTHWAAFPKSASPAAYADLQARMATLIPAFVGMALVFGPFILGLLLWHLRDWARDAVSAAQPDLQREWERQRLQDAAGPASSDSKPPRL